MIAGPYTTAELLAVLEDAPAALGVLVEVLAVLDARPLAVLPLTLVEHLRIDADTEIERGPIHAVRQAGRWYLATVTPRVSWREPGVDDAPFEPADEPEPGEGCGHVPRPLTCDACLFEGFQ